MKTKLIIFDLDGVLVDTKKIHFDSLNKALFDVNKDYVISEIEQFEIFEGLTTKQKLCILTESKGLPESMYHDIWKQKQLNSLFYLNNLSKNDLLIETFNYIKNKGISIAVATNSIKETAETCLNKLGILELIDLYLTNEDVNLPKPNSNIYNKCIEHFKVDPEEVLIIEDGYYGKIAAYNSKCKLISVDGPNEININFIENILSPSNKLNILIPMAGEGSRFKLAGYNEPKPMIMINNKTMIQTVYENINLDGQYIFIIKKDDLEKYDIENHIKSFCNNYKIIIQNEKLDGAALSALLSEEYINNDDHLLIANSDQYIEWNSKHDINNIINSGVDGSILTFTNNDPKWSYLKRSIYNIVEKVSEKNVISNEATCGIYYWNKGSDFVKYAKQMISKKIKTNNEFYICPVFNEAISDQKIISPYPIQKMYGLGTPEDLEKFLLIL